MKNGPLLGSGLVFQHFILGYWGLLLVLGSGLVFQHFILGYWGLLGSGLVFQHFLSFGLGSGLELRLFKYSYMARSCVSIFSNAFLDLSTLVNFHHFLGNRWATASNTGEAMGLAKEWSFLIKIHED